MKRISFGFVIIGLIILATGKLNAQTASAATAAETILIPAIASDDMGGPAPAENINQRALQLFKKEFKTAANVKWMNLEDGYVAKFTTGNITSRVYYHGNGTKAGVLRSYAADKLSREIQQLVADNYAGYCITYVNEACISNGEETPTYVVNLQGINHLKVVKIYDGETEVVFDSSKEPLAVKRF